MAAICQDCGQEMLEGVGCIDSTYDDMEGGPFNRLKFGEEKRFGAYTASGPCHDCGAPLDSYHHPGCDWEECPRCGGQAIGCSCGDDGDEE